MKKHVDYIIVGQGIAGTILSFQLIHQSKSILVVDKGFENSSSYVAAGLINPTVLKRITKTWRADEFSSYNDNFYDKLHSFLDGTYYHKLPFSKLINSSEEKDFWEHRYHQDNVKNYIEKDLVSIENQNQFANDFVAGKVKKTAWLNIKPLLNDFRNYLSKNESLLDESFDFDSLDLSDNSVNYKGISAERIIFCEGSNVSNNPFFNYLPMVLNKGELITIETDQFKSDIILKKKVFILPVKENTYKIGATFEWKWEDENPSEIRKKELITDFQKITTRDYKLINHEAGVRPSSRDRRPIIGLHPTNKLIGVFNGLGSRGCLMAPLLAKEFIDYLEKKSELNEEADIKRFNRFMPN